MSIRKVLAVAVMLAALIAIYVGIGYTNNYTSQITVQNPVFAKSIHVPVNGTGVIHVALNSTDADYYISETIRGGAIRAEALNRDDYARYVNGSFKPRWMYDQPTTGQSDAGFDDMMQNAAFERHYVYWNPDTPTDKEVTIKICEQTTQQVNNYAALGAGLALVAGGVVAGLAAAYFFGRKMFLTVVTLALIVWGVSMLTAYPEQSLKQETAVSFNLTVPAGSSIAEPINYNNTGYYQLTLKGPKGELNATVISEQEYADYMASRLDVYIRPWQGSHYPISQTVSYDSSTQDVRLLLVNQEDYSQNVTVQVDHVWIADADYTCNIAGGFLVALGAFIIVLSFWRPLKEFNQALGNQDQT